MGAGGAKWELPEGTLGTDGVTGWIYRCEENTGTPWIPQLLRPGCTQSTRGCPHACPPALSWISLDPSHLYLSLQAWPPFAPCASHCPDLPLGDSLDGPCSHEGQSGCHWIREGAGSGVAEGTWQLPEGWDVSLHCHSTGDAGCEVGTEQMHPNRSRFPSPGKSGAAQLPGIWALGYSRLWIHTLLKSACEGCAQQMSEPSCSVSSKLPPWIPAGKVPGAGDGAVGAITGTQSPWRGVGGALENICAHGDELDLCDAEPRVNGKEGGQ